MARQRLTRQDWIDAALIALGEQGVRGVAIESVARRLGTTKGSGYWHFASRDELLEAALQYWEQRDTDAFIAAVEPEKTALERLRALFAMTFASAKPNLVQLAVQGAPDDPIASAALRRVNRRRVDYLRAQFVELGFDRRQAQQRALLAYSAFLGDAELRRGSAELISRSPSTRRRAGEELIELLTRR